MMEASYDLNSSDSNSFGLPETPQFSYLDQVREGLDLSGQGLSHAKEIFRESFVLQKEVNQHEEQSAWSLGMANAPKIASDENESNQASEDMNDSPLRQRSARAIILSNFVDNRKVNPNLSYESEDVSSDSSEQESKKERSFDNLKNRELKLQKKSSFVLSNFSEKEVNSENLNQGQVEKQKSQSEGEDENTILEDAQPVIQQPNLIDESEQSSSNSGDFDELQSDQDKQNIPVMMPQVQLPVIREQSSGKSLEQSESIGQTINVIQQTFVRDSLYEEEQKEQLPNQSTRINEKNKVIQAVVEQSLMWKTQIVKEQGIGKRHRTKPCKFWICENVRYLKNNQIVKRYRRTIEEVFLKLTDPSEILSHNTATVTDTIMNGDITMKPKSKIKVNNIPGRVIMTILSQQIKGSFMYQNNKVKIVERDDGWCRKLVLNKPKINELKNTLEVPCKIYVKINYQN